MNLRFSILGFLLAAAVLISGYGFISPNDPWPVPEKYMKMPNPDTAGESIVSHAMVRLAKVMEQKLPRLRPSPVILVRRSLRTSQTVPYFISRLKAERICPASRRKFLTRTICGALLIISGV
jgi:hypothetical protein